MATTTKTPEIADWAERQQRAAYHLTAAKDELEQLQRTVETALEMLGTMKECTAWPVDRPFPPFSIGGDFWLAGAAVKAERELAAGLALLRQR